ncbi:hypothetical protein BAZSYMA_ACONTIG177707_0 [Bathymodiolus azoricus thioautotrophic gill symbiont]|uniref:Uncharacterized protein n=1 Tax=Bathymodiolus azoricus thioautotrophic gill symbiont TaxID=235205 RepID=A0A1H6MSQ4_9GAMM|nr:hypothetical protein BAZSYMA_ACONTIG177707_0 [Bathymodiolus azoricus thioautotrophic gill symbiont]
MLRMILVGLIMRQIMLIRQPLPPLKVMAQSWRGVTHILEVKKHPLIVAIPRFIQMNVSLLLLKLMARLRHGAA